MADEMKVDGNADERNDEPTYEAPKLEVLGTVEQLTSEFDATEPPK